MTRVALVLLLLLGTLAGAQAPPVTISIVGTSDVHGRIVGDGMRGGLAMFGGYVRNLRAARQADAGAVLVLDAGDMFQGTLESNLGEGAAMVRAYNAIGYTAAAVGNHEFDFGPVGEAATPRAAGDDPRGALKARAAQARFPLLAANVVDTATGRAVDWRNVRPSTIVEAAGVKVGIIGVTSSDTLATTIALNTRGLSIAPLAPAIAAEAARLRSAGATVIVVAAHAGGRCTRFDAPADLTSCEPGREIMAVAQQIPAGLVDVIVAGHTHASMAHEINGIAIIQSGEYGAAFGRVDLAIDRAAGTVASRRLFAPQPIAAAGDYEGRPVLADARVAAAVAPAVAAAEALKRRSLGVWLDTPLPRSSSRESGLGNLFADALRGSVPGADVAIINGGSIRISLPAGDLTYGTLFEASPFDNRLVTVVLTGEQLRRIVAHDLTRPAGQITSISGVRIAARCEGGALAIRLTRPSGTPLEDTERLRVVASDFLLAGGDGILAPAGAPVASEDVDLFMREAIAAWLRTRGGRLQESTLKPPEALRWTYPGERPVRCAETTGQTLRIYLARHGQTDWNVEGRIQGGSDTPLNATGRQQAAQLRDRLAGVRLDAVYSSTLSRSRETAEIVRGDVPLTVLEALGERRFGAFEGRLATDPVTGPALAKRRLDPDDALDGGESQNAFSARVAGAVDAIRQRHPAGTVLVVGHGGTNQMILRALLGLTLEQARTITQDNDELYLVELQAGGDPRVWKLITTATINQLE